MTNESSPSTDAPLLFDRYRVKQQVGNGRLATVYHATDERLQRDVLLHILRKDLVGQEKLRQRFINEINASAQRTHPALLNVFDSGEAQGRPFMVTEYVQGRPLNALGVLTLENALLYTRQVTGAVSACQTRSVPHPPISSSNVLLVSEGQVKLVESWLLDAADVPYDLAHYRAPELTEGHPPSPSSVVYALGLFLHELIAGSRAVQGSSAQEVIQAHKNLQIPPLSQVRPLVNLPSLEHILIRATARFPEHRLPDVIAFSEEIDALWRNLSTETQRLTVTPAIPRPRQAATTDVQPRSSVAPPSASSAPPSASSAPPSASSAPPSASSAPPSAEKATPTSDRLHPLPIETVQRKSLAHSLVGWFVMISLLLVVVFGSYTIAGLVVEKLFSITLPQPSLPDMGMTWPDWLPGGDQQEVLVVTIAANEGLNLRDRPGVSTNVLTTIPNGALVQKLADSCTVNNQTLDPCVVDGVEWVRVRAETADGQTIEGWMSRLYLKKPEE
jgi:serine/threonine protein kinase